ncbi:unnamed protein product, partial [Meganyctiphanes norvegica]
ANVILAAHTLTKRNSHIPNEQEEYCSKPQTRLFSVRNELSNNHPQALVTNREHFSHLLDGNYQFHPSHFLVNRCDRQCSNIGREDADVLPCTFRTEKVQRVINATKNDQTKQITIYINENRECTCAFTETESEQHSNYGNDKVNIGYVMYFIPIIIILLR